MKFTNIPGVISGYCFMWTLNKLFSLITSAMGSTLNQLLLISRIVELIDSLLESITYKHFQPLATQELPADMYRQMAVVFFHGFIQSELSFTWTMLLPIIIIIIMHLHCPFEACGPSFTLQSASWRQEYAWWRTGCPSHPASLQRASGGHEEALHRGHD